MRSIGAAEAYYRLYGFELCHQWPACMKLPIHGEDSKTIVFENDREAAAVAGGDPPRTKLTEWFRLNREAAENGEEPPPLYGDMTRLFRWIGKETGWMKKAGGDNGVD